MADKREVDAVSNTETTGHEWDGIKELDTPMPRWWLTTFYITIVWGVIYVILMPAWPLISGATPGILGYSSRGTVEEQIAAARAAQAPMDARLMETELATISNDGELLHYAVAGGAAIFRNNCSQCHGAGGAGAAGGYPNLLDDDWLWGGSIDDIHQTISHGIRYEEDDDTRYSQMPAFGEILEEEEIAQLVTHVRSLSGGDASPEGAVLFEENCASCHGEDGTGLREMGAPNLTDSIWLYGGDVQSIETTIRNARYGIMPAFAPRLSEADVRKVATYVHSLGGGE